MLPEKVNLFWNSQSNCNSGLEKYVRPQENPENQEWELAFGSWQNYGNQSPLEELGFQSMETSIGWAATVSNRPDCPGTEGSFLPAG